MTQEWDTVEVISTSAEADLICGFLASQGVTVEKESRLFSQEPVTFGALGNVRIRVPAGESQEARRLLRELRAEGPRLAEEAALTEPAEPDPANEKSD